MNIFVLDADPKLSAQAHCDKHVVKMILESAQLMCTAHHLHPSGNYNIPYKKTHVNHPCAKWVRNSKSNYLWLKDLTFWLNEEYKYRFNHDVNHKSFGVIDSLPTPDIPDINMTRWARAMPIEAKIDDDVVKSYRNYYKTHKQHLLKYTKRPMPTWL